MIRMASRPTTMIVFALALLFAGIESAAAQERLKIASARRGNWDTAALEIGRRLGIMRRHGITLDVAYVWDSRKAVRAILTKQADISVAADVIDVLRAYARREPIRIIANQSSGAHDLFWYVRASSPIKSWQETAGRTLAFSTDFCTRGIVSAFMHEKQLKALPVATGWPSPTLTQVLNGQIDIGWATPPFGLEHLDSGEIRILGHGSETSFGTRTTRVLATTPLVLATRRDAISRFLLGWRETIDAMYADEKALKTYADWRNMPLQQARRLRDVFYPKNALDPDRIGGLESTASQAAADLKLAGPITAAQLEKLVQPIRN